MTGEVKNIGQRPLFQLHAQISSQLEVFDIYGLGIYIPQVVKSLIRTFREFEGKIPVVEDIPPSDIRTRDL